MKISLRLKFLLIIAPLTLLALAVLAPALSSYRSIESAISNIKTDVALFRKTHGFTFALQNHARAYLAFLASADHSAAIQAFVARRYSNQMLSEWGAAILEDARRRVRTQKETESLVELLNTCNLELSSSGQYAKTQERQREIEALDFQKKCEAIIFDSSLIEEVELQLQIQETQTRDDLHHLMGLASRLVLLPYKKLSLDMEKLEASVSQISLGYNFSFALGLFIRAAGDLCLKKDKDCERAYVLAQSKVAKAFDLWMEAYSKDPQGGAGLKELERILGDFDQFSKLSERAQFYARARGPESLEFQKTISRMIPLYKSSVTIIKNALQKDEQNMEAVLKNFVQRARYIGLGMFGLVVLILVFGLGIPVVFFQRIARPILKIQTAVSKFGAKQEEIHIDINTNDELENLAVTFNQMAKNIIETEKALAIAKDAALRASQYKSEFLANMSHEIRTPLNAVIGISSQFADTPLDEEQKEYTRLLRSAGDTLLNLINDILDLSKVEAGQLDLEETYFDLSEIVAQICELMAFRASEKGLELIYHIESNVPRDLIGDPVRLRQIIVNLFGNAIKFTEKGEISLKIRNNPESSLPGSLLFSVSDTGIGIPQDKLALVFERFAQSDSSTTRKYGGTGLGLTISKHLAELMKGKIWPESALGKGTTFHFTAQFGLAPLKSRPKLPLEILKNYRILLADDSPMNRLILRDILSTWTLKVDEAEDGSEALRKIFHAQQEAKPYQMILLDVYMPGKDGFQVVEKMREDPSLDDTIIIMLTSGGKSGEISRVKKLGITRYLTKPIRREIVLEAIMNALRERGVIPISEVSKSAPEVSVAPGPGFKRPLKILVAEDYPVNRILMQSYFKKTPHEVTLVSNGQEALEEFKTNHYDIVFLDGTMPVMDGYTATQEMRILENTRGMKPTPIIALTAHAFKEDIQKSLKAGFTAHLSKPIKKERLFEAIERYAQEAPQEDAEAAERIIIRVSSEFKDIMPDVLESLKNSLQNMRKALADKDFETIYRLGHNLKGSGSSYCFDLVSEKGALIEKAAKLKNETDIQEALDALFSYLKQVEVVYDEK